MSVLFRIALLFVVVVVVILTFVSIYSTFCFSPIHIKKQIKAEVDPVRYSKVPVASLR